MSSERSKPLERLETETSIFPYGSQDDEALAQESPLLTSLGIEHRHKIFETILNLKNALTLTNPATDSEELRRLWLDYSEQFEVLAEETHDNEAYVKIHLAAIFHKAFIFRDEEKPLLYAEELDIAEMYTRNVGFTALSTVLDEEIDIVITHLEPCPELLILQLRDVMTDYNREVLRRFWLEDHNFKDLINCIREFLIDDHKNPEEILSKFDIKKYEPKL